MSWPLLADVGDNDHTHVALSCYIMNMRLLGPNFSSLSELQLIQS
jgi:hypothetical protein